MKIINKFNKILIITLSMIINTTNTMHKIADALRDNNLTSINAMKQSGVEDIDAKKIIAFANLLFYQKLQIEALKAILPYTQELINTALPSQPVYLHINMNAKYPDDYIVINVNTQEAHEIYDKSILMTSKVNAVKTFAKKCELKLQYFNYFDSLLKDGNLSKDIKLIAIENKHYFTKSIINNSIGGPDLITKSLIELVTYLAPKHFLLDLKAATLDASIKGKSFELIESWLAKTGYLEDIVKFMPDLLPMCKAVNEIHNLFNFLPKSQVFNLKQATDLHTAILKTVEEYEPKQEKYDLLYEQIISDINNIIKNSKFNAKEKIVYKLVLTKFLLNFSSYEYKNLPLSLNNKETKSILEEFIGVKLVDNKSPIIKQIASTKKPKKTQVIQQVSKSKKEKQQRAKKTAAKVERKKQQRLEQEKLEQEKVLKLQEEQERCEQKRLKKLQAEIELKDFLYNQYYQYQPTYASRVIEWFEREFTQEELLSDREKEYNKSILYHTYSPLVDLFIQKYGKKESYNNLKDQRQDTRYYIFGIIKYINGEIMDVAFEHTLSIIDGICYHRGFIKDIISPITVNKKLNILKSISNMKIHKLDLIINNKTYTNQEYKETKDFIIVKDTKNHVDLILLKP